MQRNGRKQDHPLRLTGTGYFDMTAYAAYNRGDMRDYIPTDEDLKASIEALPKIPGIQE